MKQKLTQLLFVLTFICFAQLIVAQEFGIRAGVNLANVSGTEASTSSIIGFQFGPVAEFGLSESIALNVAALYSMKGAKADLYTYESKLKINYLDVPVLLHYDFGGFYAEVGPQLSMRLSADVDGEDAKDFIKSSDFSALIGVGYDLGSIRIDARYGIGLSNVSDESDEDNTIKNNVITLGVSYMFGGDSGSDE